MSLLFLDCIDLLKNMQEGELFIKIVKIPKIFKYHFMDYSFIANNSLTVKY